jgi:hypothetical protein
MRKNLFLSILVFIFFSIGFSNLAIATEETYSCASGICNPNISYIVDPTDTLVLTAQCTDPQNPQFDAAVTLGSAGLSCTETKTIQSKTWTCPNNSAEQRFLVLQYVSCRHYDLTPIYSCTKQTCTPQTSYSLPENSYTKDPLRLTVQCSSSTYPYLHETITQKSSNVSCTEKTTDSSKILTCYNNSSAQQGTLQLQSVNCSDDD